MNTIGLVATALHTWETGVLLYFLAVNSFYALLLAAAWLEVRALWRSMGGEVLTSLIDSDVAPRISLLAPAYNEEATVVESVRALLSLYYPRLEVVVVNDGSRDATLEALRAAFDLVAVESVVEGTVPTRPIRRRYRSRRHPNLVVVDKENGGKADALNAALNVAAGELVCAMDADTLLEPDALRRLVRPFLFADDVVAAGGNIRVINGSAARNGRVECRTPRRPLPGFQVVEYTRAFLFGRLGFNRVGGNLIISGAFGLFRRAQVLAAGGYRHDTVGEDMELVVRLRRLGYESGRPARVVFVPDPVAWTEVPESVRVLGRQRDRWHRGLADVLWRHRRVLLNPRYGAMGLIAYPYFAFVELLAPVVEALGLVGLIVCLVVGWVDATFAELFFLTAYGYGLVLTLVALLIEEVTFHRAARVVDRVWLIVWSALECLGYRQLTVVWRLRGLWKYLRGRRDWGAMERRGFGGTPRPPAQDRASHVGLTDVRPREA
jgi:cellulose synthase/poly-beta-1,6-N-acetylglucosamine synthase-like glycosyltransferase